MRAPEKQAAITAATARFVAARRATELALQNPTKADRAVLERAGDGGRWLADTIDDITFYRDNGWYQAGSVKLSSPDVKSVRLTTQQPEITLTFGTRRRTNPYRLVRTMAHAI